MISIFAQNRGVLAANSARVNVESLRVDDKIRAAAQVACHGLAVEIEQRSNSRANAPAVVVEHGSNRNRITRGDSLLEPVVRSQYLDAGAQLLGVRREKFVDDDRTDLERFTRTRVDVVFHGPHDREQGDDLRHAEWHYRQQQQFCSKGRTQLHNNLLACSWRRVSGL